jgi:hypothetical protein
MTLDVETGGDLRQVLLLPLLLTSTMALGCSAVSNMQEGIGAAEQIVDAVHDELNASADVRVDALSGPEIINCSITLKVADVAAHNVGELRDALAAIVKAKTGREVGTLNILLE